METAPSDIQKHDSFIADNFLSPPNLEEFFKLLPPDLSEWIEVFLKLQIHGVKSHETVRAVKSDLNKFKGFFEYYYQSSDIRKWFPRTTQRFINHLAGEKGQKPKTINRNLVSLRSFAKWLISVRPDLLTLGDPFKGIRPPVQEPIRPKGLNDRQVKHILDAAYHLICQNYPDESLIKVHSCRQEWHKKGHRKMKRPFRDYAIIMLLLNGGLRRSEICNLNISQLQGRHLKHVKCKGNLYRDVLLGEETIKAIKGYMEEERAVDCQILTASEALFLPSASRKHRNQNGRLSPRLINVIVSNIEKETNKNLPKEEHIKLHPHIFRHTHAYQILKHGRSLPYLQKRLGHQSMNFLALYAQMPETEEMELLNGAEFT
ncbi:MAG TPA: tyrosine-type recombinase/integrase [Thermodesulfovibrionia bacterium]|nr:tyrosine-type recombinase/integrase [Thermodesulfovibrionia bacterium]